MQWYGEKRKSLDTEASYQLEARIYQHCYFSFPWLNIEIYSTQLKSRKEIAWWHLIYLRLMFPKIDTLLDILLLMISVLSYWSRLYQHQMAAKPSYSASNNPGNRRKVKSREYGCIWWINTNNYALLAVSSNSNIRTQVGIFFMGFI